MAFVLPRSLLPSASRILDLDKALLGAENPYKISNKVPILGLGSISVDNYASMIAMNSTLKARPNRCAFHIFRIG